MHAQVNEFCKRVRALRIHMLIVGHLRKQMPALMGKKAAQERLLKNLAEEFGHVQREHHLPPGARASAYLLTHAWQQDLQNVCVQPNASIVAVLHDVASYVMTCDANRHDAQGYMVKKRKLGLCHWLL